MNRAATTTAMGECAAALLSMARQLERNAGDPVDAISADMLDWASESRSYAGACIAAINHINGVSPE